MTRGRTRGRRASGIALVAMAFVAQAMSGTARATSPVAITNVLLSTQTVSVVGAEVSTALTVTAHITSSDPIVPGDSCAGRSPDVVFSNGGSGRLVLVSGTNTDGDWAATVPVTAAWKGDWHLAGVYVYPNSLCEMDSTLDWAANVSDPALALHVAATNAPGLVASYSPNPVPWNTNAIQLSGRLTLADGTPLAGKIVHALAEMRLLTTATTNADGHFRGLQLLKGVSNFYWVSDPANAAGDEPVFVWKTSVVPRYLTYLGVTRTVPAVRLGRFVDIHAQQIPGTAQFGVALHLQRYAAGRWHDVPATVRSRLSNQYAFAFGQKIRLLDIVFHSRPIVRGDLRYRVQARPDDQGRGIVASTTSVVLVRVR